MRGSAMSVPEVVAMELRAEILDGTIAAGERVKEEAVEERFAIGRHTARAALSQLVERRLLTHVRNHGASVPMPTAELVDEVYDYRGTLELGALRIALGRDADFGSLVDAVEQLEALPHDAPWALATSAHQVLHHSIVAAAGNLRLLRAYEKCEDELQFLLVSLRPDYSTGGLAELHRQLVDAIIAGHDGAITALEEDIALGRHALHSCLALEGSASQAGGVLTE